MSAKASRYWVGLVMLTASLATSLPAAEAWVDVTTLAGERVAGSLKSWEATRLVVEGETAREVPMAEVLSIRFPRHVRRLATGRCVVLVNGDRFAADPVRSRDEQLTATWTHAPLRPELSFPLEHVAALVFAAPPGPAEFGDTLAALHRAASGIDTVRLIAGDNLTGEFQQLDGGLLELKAAVGSLKLDRSRVRWLALDPELGSFPKPASTHWIAFLTDGSRITATDCQPRTDFTVQLSLAGGRLVAIPRHEISRLQRISKQSIPLSERAPKEVKQQPYLSGQQELVRDRSAGGSPLFVRSEEFALGLGMRSRMSASYDIGSNDRWFQSGVAIDDAAGGRGSARFRIELDGIEAWASGEVTGHSELIATPRIDLTGHRVLTLSVEFGERGDVGDLADWCDPLLIRSR
ncbi:MAG TPA: NPCBM/NEW2 domain-containing protein [Planctomycetaceae bacterium]|nr:NPCBM/NEW2 domain-containing protein [Planctomycetaceae bacterium]